MSEAGVERRILFFFFSLQRMEGRHFCKLDVADHVAALSPSQTLCGGAPAQHLPAPPDVVALAGTCLDLSPPIPALMGC